MNEWIFILVLLLSWFRPECDYHISVLENKPYSNKFFFSFLSYRTDNHCILIMVLLLSCFRPGSNYHISTHEINQIQFSFSFLLSHKNEWILFWYCYCWFRSETNYHNSTLENKQFSNFSFVRPDWKSPYFHNDIAENELGNKALKHKTMLGSWKWI